MVKKVEEYECEKCRKRFEGSQEGLALAKEHEAIPVDTPLPEGLIFSRLRWDPQQLISSSFYYGIVEIDKYIRESILKEGRRLSESHAPMQAVEWYEGKHLLEEGQISLYTIIEESSDGIRENLKQKEYRLLTIEEFRRIVGRMKGRSYSEKEDDPRFDYSKILKRTTPELEALLKEEGK